MGSGGLRVCECVCVRFCLHMLMFLHEQVLKTPEPVLWNKAYQWCSSLAVCVCVHICSSACVFIVFHGMCVTCGCLWPGGTKGEREREREETIWREGGNAEDQQ